MNEKAHPALGYRFGAFEADVRAGELRKHGIRLRVQEKPFQILLALLERPGEVITREELHHRLWNGDTFVEFDHNLNNAVARLREALSDSSDAPRFIETLHGRGYRLLAPVEALNGAAPCISTPTTETQPAMAHSKAIRRRWLIAATLAGVLVAALGWGLWRTRQPAIAFQERDWVLITSFQNRTGEALFDGLLEYSLERELSSSRFVNVVPRQRVEDVLQLMKKPPGAPIDAAVGREVCLRDGAIRTMLNGKIEKVGSHYLLSVNFVDPASGVTLAGLSEEADGQDEILSALGLLARRVRGRLGERLSQPASRNQKLEKATTASLRALQLYSRGMVLINQNRWADAAVFMEQALAEDPQFASAHIYLAHCYSNLGRDSVAVPHYEHAFALASATPDRERYFIRGSYYLRFLKDDAKAIENYETLVGLYPDDYWGTNNLVSTYFRMGPKAGDREKATSFFIRAAELQPNNALVQANTARSIAIWDNDFLRAKRFAFRARELTSTGGYRLPSPFLTAWLDVFPAVESWLEGKIERALAEAVSNERRIAAKSGWEREFLTLYVAGFYLNLGKRRAAEECYRKLEDPLELAWSAYLLGDRRLSREHFRHADARRVGSHSVILMIRLGLIPEAKKVLASMDKGGHATEETKRIAAGELALARNRNAEAVAILQPAKLDGPIPLTLFLGLESLATAWERQGDLKKAVDALERASTLRLRLVPENGDLWLRSRWRLAQLYRRLGRMDDARRIEAELLKLLAVADSDYPILVELKRLQNSTPLQSASHHGDNPPTR